MNHIRLLGWTSVFLLQRRAVHRWIMQTTGRHEAPKYGYKILTTSELLDIIGRAALFKWNWWDFSFCNQVVSLIRTPLPTDPLGRRKLKRHQLYMKFSNFYTWIFYRVTYFEPFHFLYLNFFLFIHKKGNKTTSFLHAHRERNACDFFWTSLSFRMF